MLVRWRPEIFVSSSIRGMEEARLRIKTAIEALDLAESWLFEYSATTAGSEPADQYVQSARDCDVFVLIVGDEIRGGTAEEYEAAISDSPTKILAFFVGAGSSKVAAFRALVRDRHTVMPVPDIEGLPEAVADAVRRFVESGDIVRPVLIAGVGEVQSERRLALGVPDGFEFQRSLAGRDSGNHDPASLLDGQGHSVLTGEAGSGKSDTALGALLKVALGDHPPLPLLLATRPETTVVELLIQEALSRVRFTAGDDLIRQYLSDGRVALVVDGIDELPPDRADDTYRALIDAAERYPRTPMLVLTRNLDIGLPARWSRFELTPLKATDLDSLFEAFGYEDPHTSWSVPSDLRDLVRLPFWAILVAQFGRSADSGISLLESLVESRIQVGLPANELRRESLREAIGWLALAIQPAADAATDRTLDVIAKWLMRTEIANRFEGRTAQSIIEDAQRAGLLTVEQGTIRFVHPLVATFLAASRASKLATPINPTLPNDFAAMAAVLLPEERGAEAAMLLGAGGILVASKALRLTAPQAREPAPGDLERFDRAYQTLHEGVFDQGVEGTWHRLVTGDYHCLRQASGTEPTESRDVSLASWTASDRQAAEYFCWPTDPFRREPPVLLAANLILDTFKRRLIDLKPEADDYAPRAKEANLLPLTEEKKQVIIEHVLAQGAARRAFLSAIGLRGTVLDNETGAPTVTIYTNPSGVWYSTEWGGDTASVVAADAAPDHGTTVTELLADPQAVAYRHVISDIEAHIGSSVTTQAVRHPSVFDWAM